MLTVSFVSLLWAGVLIWGLVLLLCGVLSLVTEFPRTMYRAMRYERRGICGECRLPYAEGRQASADQMYGPDVLTQWVCPNGHLSTVQGQRRYAEW